MEKCKAFTDFSVDINKFQGDYFLLLMFSFGWGHARPSSKREMTVLIDRHLKMNWVCTISISLCCQYFQYSRLGSVLSGWGKLGSGVTSISHASITAMVFRFRAKGSALEKCVLLVMFQSNSTRSTVEVIAMDMLWSHLVSEDCFQVAI